MTSSRRTNDGSPLEVEASTAGATSHRDHDGRCISCGAEIDHYLGCPDDPNPDYEAEAQLQERGSLEELGWESLGHGNAPMGEL